MSFGLETLRRGSKGKSVEELQLRLAGFRGSVWDGDFGPGTELQVQNFQREFMGDERPDGVVGPKTFAAIKELSIRFPIDMDSAKCPCGSCPGFGEARFKGEYRNGKPEIEAYHHYEYPGIHKAILHSFRASLFHCVKNEIPKPFLTSAYRCWVNNEQKARKSTNHMGKALDIDFPILEGEEKRDDLKRCDQVRSLLVEKANFQIGWTGRNTKSFEPSLIAPTWIHMDVRSYEKKYLNERFFVRTAEELDGDSARINRT